MSRRVSCLPGSQFALALPTRLPSPRAGGVRTDVGLENAPNVSYLLIRFCHTRVCLNATTNKTRYLWSEEGARERRQTAVKCRSPLGTPARW